VQLGLVRFGGFLAVNTEDVSGKWSVVALYVYC
jgi:hypothetical protein